MFNVYFHLLGAKGLRIWEKFYLSTLNVLEHKLLPVITSIIVLLLLLHFKLLHITSNYW